VPSQYRSQRPTRKRRQHSTQKVPSPTASLILLNKPFGIVSQFSGDDHTLARLISIKDVYPAGRLDKDSEGLLLLTDQGWLQHRIAHPKTKTLKHYQVQVEGEIDNKAIQRLLVGVDLKDGPAQAVLARRIDEPEQLWTRDPPVRFRKNVPTSWLEIAIGEGRNRQVRRMTAAAGFPTLRLIRHRIGDWHLNGLAPGQFRQLRIRRNL